MVENIIIPVAAILVSSGIAIWLANRERKAAERARLQERADALADRAKERRLDAAAGVLTSLATLVSMDPTNELVRDHMRGLRGTIAVYQGWIDKDDRSGDWLGLRHAELMILWMAAMKRWDDLTKTNLHAPSDDEMFATFDPPRQHSQDTISMLVGWLSGHTATDELMKDGARIIKKIPGVGGTPV